MGEELCKPCENYVKGEDRNLSQPESKQNFNKDLDNEIPQLSELCKNLKKKPTKLNKKTENVNGNSNLNNNNYDNMKSTMFKTSVSKNEEASLATKVVVDEKELNKIIKNYSANLLISNFKKFKQMKEEAHQKIHYKSNLKEKRDLILPEGDGDFDIDLFPEETYNYLGNIFIEKKDGFGIQFFPKSDSSYIGNFSKDKRIGVCKFEDKSKEYTFNGYTNLNFAGEYGIYNNYGKGLNYEGEWNNNRKNGIGIEKSKDGDLYQGEFKNGFKHGIGTYYWADGCEYEGEWKYNVLDGYGIYKFKDGSFCSGIWLSNQMNGFGKFTYPGIKYYLGFFKKDNKSGFGLIFWIKERKVFIGFWKNNKQNGLGKFISNENIRYGFWEEGKKTSKYNENEFFNLLKEQNIPQLYIDIYGMDYDGVNEYIQNFNEL